MRKIIVTTGTMLEAVKRHCLQEHEALLGTQILPFEVAFPLSSYSNIELETLVFKQLSEQGLPILHDSLPFPKTIQDLIALAKELQLYQIPLSQLPTATPLEQEIKTCLEIITSFLTKPQLQNNYEYSYYESGLTHAQKTFLDAQHIKQNQISNHQPLKTHGYVANNLRQEIEAIAQDIDQHPETTVTLIVPNLKQTLPVIETVFKRYNLDIPTTNRETDLVVQQFIALMEWLRFPSVKTMTTLIHAQAFNLSGGQNLLFFLEQTYTNDTSILNLNTLLNHPYYYHEKTSVYYQTLLNFLTEAPKTFPEHISYVYETLRSQTTKNLSPLKVFIETNLKFYDETTYPLFLNQLLKIKSPNNLSETIQIVDFDNPPLHTDQRRYLLNLSVQNYPGIQSSQGLVGAAYRHKIIGYPELQDQTEYILKKHEQLFTNCETLILSYHTTDYEGKDQEVAFNIKNRVTNFKSWPLKQITHGATKPLKLSSEIAKQLFFKDDVLTGSISSLQRYATNPLDYFIETGLNIRRVEPKTLDARSLGIYNHEIMEKNNLTVPNDYQDFQIPFYTMVLSRNHDLMAINLDHVKEAFQTTDFKPWEQEKYFTDMELFQHFRLKGIIDRLDWSDDFALITDYKSSFQSLSPKNIQTGMQLQLLTYALIVQKYFQKPVLGVFYYSFAQKNLKIPNYSYTVAQGLTKTDDRVGREKWFESKQFSGWFFDDPTTLIHDERYFKGLRRKKDELVLYGKSYDLENVATLLEQVYHNLYDALAHGILDIDDFDFEIDTHLNLKKGAPQNDPV